MYRILIADDEKDERDAISFLIRKYQFPLEIIEASNGREALERISELVPDILFTDIKMPFLNGIELTAKVKELYPDMQVIFFSGYDDFEYVKEALSLRAVNYILKPVNPQEFQKTIASVIDVMKQKEAQISRENANRNFLKNHILYQLLNNADTKNIAKYYPDIDTSFLESYKQMLLIQFEVDFFNSHLSDNEVEGFLKDVDSLLPELSTYLNLNPSQSILLLTDTYLKSVTLKNIACRLQQHFTDTFHQVCHIAISPLISCSSEMSKVLKETEGFLEERFFFPCKYIYAESPVYTGETNPAEDDMFLKNIEKDIQFKDIYSLKQNITLLIQKYENQTSFSHIYVRYLFTNLLQIMLSNLSDYEESKFWEISEKIYQFRYFSHIKELLLETLNQLIQKIEGEQESPKHAIHLVDKYIKEHYKEDLSLNILAEKVYLTPRYLSSLFIQETGYGINKYIKNVRMEKAKELLLKTNLKVSDISQEVGYSNVSYFCKSFQEDFGSTPDKYRQHYLS